MEETKKFKVGLDIHGVVDAIPDFFCMLTRLLVDAGHEVHVLTGSEWSEEVEEELRSYGISWTHHFSITDHGRETGVNVWYDEKNTPWMDNDAWDRAKGEYCERVGMDFHVDDTVKYNDHFTTPFCRLWTHNGHNNKAKKPDRLKG